MTGVILKGPPSPFGQSVISGKKVGIIFLVAILLIELRLK